HRHEHDGAATSPAEPLALAHPAVNLNHVIAGELDRPPALASVPLRVLVVDDDVRNVFALTNALEVQGIEVLFAESGREALDVLLRTPDVNGILMDIMMPELDGYAAIKAIRNIPQFAELPIIALTAKAMKGDRENALAAGATDYIAKPVEVDELLAKIRASVRQ